MKTLVRNQGGEWTEVFPLTQSQLDEMASATAERRREIAASIRRPADAADAASAQALCEKNMVEGAVLISCDVSLPDGVGLINCRVDGVHRQVRF